MKVSIALATYNGAEFIREQLESFALQTRLPDEVVVCDDGSSDATLDIVRQFAQKASFPVYVWSNSRNLGVTQNFSRALEYCTGDLIFLSDQDDVWFPRKLEKICAVASKKPSVLLFMNNAEIVDRYLDGQGVTKLGQFDSAGIERASFVMGCCMALRQELVDLAVPIPSGCDSHDDWISLISRAMNSKVVVDEPLQFYRIHGRNESDFIVNRPTRVTKSRVLLWRVRRALSSIWGNKQPDRIFKTLEALAELADRLDGDQDPRYRQLQVFANAEYQMSRLRFEARSKPFSQRLLAVLKLVRIGAYGSPATLRLILKDLLG